MDDKKSSNGDFQTIQKIKKVVAAVEQAAGKGIESVIEEEIDAGIDVAVKSSIKAAVSKTGLYASLAVIDLDAANHVEETVGKVTHEVMAIIEDRLQKYFEDVHGKFFLPTLDILVKLRMLCDLADNEPEIKPDYHNFIDEMNSFGEDAPFTVFVIRKGEEIIHAVPVCDEELNKLLDDQSCFRNKALKIISGFTNYNCVPDSAKTASLITVDVSFGRKVKFASLNVYNVTGSSHDHRVNNWKLFWEKAYNQVAAQCLIATPLPHNKPIVGGHMEKEVADNSWYILPICNYHNSKKFDRPKNVMTTTTDGRAVKITKKTPQNYLIKEEEQHMQDSNVDISAHVNIAKFVESTTKAIIPSFLGSLFAKITNAINEADANVGDVQREGCMDQFQSIAAMKMTEVVDAFQWNREAVMKAIKATSSSPEWKAFLADLNVNI